MNAKDEAIRDLLRVLRPYREENGAVVRQVEDAMSHGRKALLAKDVPDWLVIARDHILCNGEDAGGAMEEPAPVNLADQSDDFQAGYEHGYWGGYYDACRHALKALPPHVKHPDPEDWIEDGFKPPEALR